MASNEFTLYAPPDEILELAMACMVGLCANEEAPHHKPRELAARAFDYAQAFYDELDARAAAAEAKESESGPTEPPESPFASFGPELLDNVTAPDEIDEDPAESVNELVTAQPQRVWTDLDRAPQS